MMARHRWTGSSMASSNTSEVKYNLYHIILKLCIFLSLFIVFGI